MPTLKTVILCSECEYFMPFHESTQSFDNYGTCGRRIFSGIAIKKTDYCSYASPRKPNAEPLPEYDDHTASGLLDD